MSKKSRIIGIGIVVLIILYVSLFLFDHTNDETRFGISFDPDYARYMSTDAGKAYLTALNDWHFRLIRLPAHWDTVEKVRGHYDFSDIDWYVNRAKDAGASLVIAVGQKTPRWPECHVPTWAEKLDKATYQTALKKYISAVIDHYKNNPAIEMWQVENESLLHFGLCPSLTANELRDEINFVKQLDPTRPTTVTDSGELSSWLTTGTAGDYFGTTVYRLVYNNVLGFIHYTFIPAEFYRLKLWLSGREATKAFVIELQAEPWITDQPITKVSLQEQYQSMNLEQVQNNVVYAKKIGFSRVYLWGAEWWYWLLEHNRRDIPEYIKTLPK